MDTVLRGGVAVKPSGGVLGPAICARRALRPPTPATAWKKLLRETFMPYLQKQNIRPHYIYTLKFAGLGPKRVHGTLLQSPHMMKCVVPLLLVVSAFAQKQP